MDFKRDRETIGEIGCVIMASGLSVRFGKNKLLEKLNGREVILHTVSCAASAGLFPVTVARSPEVKSLLEENAFPCILHDGPRKSDTMHTGLRSLGEEKAGFLFMQGDQPLILPGTLERLVREFLREPGTPIRLGYAGIKGSPVIFPAGLRQALLSYEGDRGGMEVLRRTGFPCRILEASHEWELWDVDTPDSMEKARKLLCQGL